MGFREIAAKIGVMQYPEKLDRLYNELSSTTESACNLALIDRLQEEHDLFGKYYDIVRNTAQTVNADETYSAWVRVTANYIIEADLREARRLPIPAADVAEVTPLLPLYMMLPQIEQGISEYRRRGFGEEELAERISAYRNGIATVEARTGEPGIDKVYYHWLMLFAKARIFKTQGVQFEMRTMLRSAIYLRHKESKAVAAVMLRGKFHASGIQHLGSGGFEDSAGAFEPTFTEDNENYYGHSVDNGRVSAKPQVFSKKDWEIFAKPGDPCFAMHFPKGADISQESLDRAYASARKIVKERYPEFKGQLVECVSWLLDPTLVEILGEKSRISVFSKSFIKYPQKGAGREGFGYVFGKFSGDLADLPEETSLQRGLKQLYLSGGHTFSYVGIWYRGGDHYESFSDR